MEGGSTISGATGSGVVTCGDCAFDTSDMDDALREASDDAVEDVVASRMYSTTSQVWRVASGAKETRRAAAYNG